VAVFAALASGEHQARRQAITVLLSSGFEDPADRRSFTILGRSPDAAGSQEELAQRWPHRQEGDSSC